MLGKFFALIGFLMSIGSFFPTLEEQHKLVAEGKDFSLGVRQILKYLNEKIINHSIIYTSSRGTKIMSIEYLFVIIFSLIISGALSILFVTYFKINLGSFTGILLGILGALTGYIITGFFIFFLLVFNFMVIGLLFFINILLKNMGVFTKLYDMSYLVRFFGVILMLVGILLELF